MFLFNHNLLIYFFRTFSAYIIHIYTVYSTEVSGFDFHLISFIKSFYKMVVSVYIYIYIHRNIFNIFIKMLLVFSLNNIYMYINVYI